MLGVLFGGAGGGAVFELFYSANLEHPERSVHVAVPALWQALEQVYEAPNVVRELARQ